MSNRFQCSPALARVAIGLTGTASMMSSGVFVFGPFSDLSTLQLAAGPSHAIGTAISEAAPIVHANTGRSWAAYVQHRPSAVAAAHVARPDELNGP